jgi:hypothetical protein
VYLKTSGKPTKAKLNFCKDATKFFGRKLLGEILYHKVTVKIIFERFDKKLKEYAFCESENIAIYRCKEFVITIDKDLNTKQMLLALAHEMVHVKQYAKGELKDYVKVNKSKWKGEIIDPDRVDYWDQPWEIEAHGREVGLYVKFLESLKKKK